MPSVDVAGLSEFGRDYPGMAIRPSRNSGLRLKGVFEFEAQHEEWGSIRDAFKLTIQVPDSFPRELPVVFETARRIPSVGSFHVNSDGSLCLGSPLELKIQLAKCPTLVGFAKNCLVPYLYAVSRKLKTGTALPFGELKHGSPGLYDDYRRLLQLRSDEAVRDALVLLGLRKRVANKRPCPCRCGTRLGRCSYRFRLLRIRTVASRAWFRGQARELLETPTKRSTDDRP